MTAVIQDRKHIDSHIKKNRWFLERKYIVVEVNVEKSVCVWAIYKFNNN